MLNRFLSCWDDVSQRLCGNPRASGPVALEDTVAFVNLDAGLPSMFWASQFARARARIVSPVLSNKVTTLDPPGPGRGCKGGKLRCGGSPG